MNEVYTPRHARRSVRRTLRGVDYHVSEWGDPEAPLLIYLHGWGDTGSTFQFVADAFEGDWHVVAPDWRGFGRTAHVGTSYWFPDYVADLHAFIETYSPDEPVTLIGHSMGGNVASLYAGAMPNRVRSLVNVEGFGLRDRDPGEAPRHFRRWLTILDAKPAYSTYATFEELVPRILNRSPRMPKERARFVAREWATEAASGEVCLRADPLHKLPNAVLYRRQEARACWRAIESGTLAVAGEHSGLEPAARAWLAEVTTGEPRTDARLETLPDAGHMIHFEAPGALARTIEAFVTR